MDFDKEKFDKMKADIFNDNFDSENFKKMKEEVSKTSRMDDLSEEFVKWYDGYVKDIEFFYQGLVLERAEGSPYTEDSFRDAFNELIVVHQSMGKKDFKSIYAEVLKDILILLAKNYLPMVEENISQYGVGIQKIDSSIKEYMIRGTCKGLIGIFNKANGMEEFDDYAMEISQKFVRRLASNIHLLDGIEETENPKMSPDDRYKVMESYRKNIFG